MTAKVAHEPTAFQPERLVLTKEGKLLEERIAVFLSPNSMEFDPVHQSPFRAPDQALLGATPWRKLPLIACEDQAWHAAHGAPHLVQPVKMLFEELWRFVDHDQVVARHHTHGFGHGSWKTNAPWHVSRSTSGWRCRIRAL